MKNFTRILLLSSLFVIGGGLQTLIAQPVNDQCAGAISVGSLPWTSSAYDVTLATTTGDPTAPSCQSSIARSIWFAFTPAVTGSYYLSTCQSDAPLSTVPDIVLGVYTGTCGGSFTQVTCDDDACTTLSNQAVVASVTLTGGTTYYIVCWQYCSSCSAPTVGSESISLHVKLGPDMTYTSTTSTQISTATTAGGVDQQVIQAQVVTANSNNPLSATEIVFNTTGTTNVADLSNAKVYYTGTSSTFSAIGQFGSTIANPSGVLTFTGTQVLSTGTNYFWLAYDLPCGAINANVIDGQYTSITVAAIARTPTLTNPTGTRAISGFTVTTSQPSSATVNVGSQYNQILRLAVVGSATCGQVTQLNLATTGTTAPATDLSTARVYYTGTTTTFTDGAAAGTQFGSDISSPSGAMVFNGTQTLVTGTNYFFLVYDLPCGAVNANVLDAACTNIVYNGATLTPATANPTGTRAISGFTVTTSQPSSAAVNAGGQYNQILRLAVVGSAACGQVTQLNLATTGTTAPATDLSTARVYYTGTTSTFTDGAAAGTQFGSDITSPSGVMVFNGTQTLVTGTNYFFLVYDLPCGAVNANVLDAACTNIVYNGATLTPATANPTGTRAISGFSVTTNQSSSASVSAGTQYNQILRLAVVGNATCGQVTQLNLATTGTTAPVTDLSTARVYYTGTTTTFTDGAAAGTQFGSDISSPSGTMVFNGTQTLVTGTNYFFLVYDLPCGAVNANVLDAACTNIVYNGATLTPSTANPAGTRTIAAVAFTTIANGAWSNPATWNACGIPPNGTTSAININHNVTLDADVNVQSTVTVLVAKTFTVSTNTFTIGGAGTGTQNLVINGTVNVSGGTLNVGTNTAVTTSDISVATGGNLTLNSGTINLGPTGGYKRALTTTGTGIINVTGGTLNVNGSISAIKFNQSAGNINVDGNAAGVAGNSVSGIILSFSPAVASDLTLTGGILTIVDPTVSTNTGNTFQVAYSPVGSVSASPSHIFRFGDGVSTDAGSTSGFLVYTWSGSGIFRFGSLELLGSASGSNRFVLINGTFFPFAVTGDMNIGTNAEFRQTATATTATFVFAGNLINNGTLTTLGTVYLGNVTSSSGTTLTFSATSTAQTISGTGIFRNLTASQTANFTTLTVNNTNSAGVTISSASALTGSGTGSVSGTLTLTAGKINNASPLTLGISTSTLGTLSGGSSTTYITGEFRRWNGATSGTTARIFPIGSTSSYQPCTINFTTAQSVAGLMSALFTASSPSTTGLPLLDGGITCTDVSPSGFWTVERISGSGGIYTADMNASGFTKIGGSAITDFTGIRLLKATTSGPWISSDGTPPAPAGLSSVTRPGCITFSKFAIGGIATALPLELASFTGKTEIRSNMLLWETLTEKNVQWHIVERSVDGIKWMEVGKKAGKMDSQVAVKYELEDRAPLAKAYYRLRSVDVDGAENLSSTIILTRKGEHFGITAAFPSPTKDQVTVQFASLTEENVTIRVTDFTGRLVLEQEFAAENGINEVPVQLANLQAGVYLVSISNATSTAEPMRIVKE